MRRFTGHSRFNLILGTLIILSIAGGCAKRQVPLEPPGVRAASSDSASSSPNIGGDDIALPEAPAPSTMGSSREVDSGSLGRSGGLGDLADSGGSGGDGGMNPGNIAEETLAESALSGMGGSFSGEGSKAGGLGNLAPGDPGSGQGSSGDFMPPASESLESPIREGFSSPEFHASESEKGASSRSGGDSHVASMSPFQASSDLGDIHFNFDRHDLDDLAKETLNKNADWLKANLDVKVEIQGHADERGTNNYNLALGERRANSTKKYLTALGVSKDRMRTISYGEEKPFCTESHMNCWWQNRRGHFLVSK